MTDHPNGREGSVSQQMREEAERWASTNGRLDYLSLMNLFEQRVKDHLAGQRSGFERACAQIGEVPEDYNPTFNMQPSEKVEGSVLQKQLEMRDRVVHRRAYLRALEDFKNASQNLTRLEGPGAPYVSLGEVVQIWNQLKAEMSEG